MLVKTRILLLILSCCFVLTVLSVSASAQAVPVYVAGGPTIYECLNGSCTPFTLTGVSGVNFASLAIGPDSVDLDAAGNPLHPFLLYACDTGTTSNTLSNVEQIIRFDPTSGTTVTPQSVAVAAGLGIAPICGRTSATGDFYVTNELGPDVFQLVASFHNQTTPLADIPFTQTAINASALSINNFAGMTGRAITQKYIGDMLVVDNFHNQVLRSGYATPPPALFSTLSTFITSNLNGPVGLVNVPSLRREFVANTNSVKNLATEPAVTIFDSAGAPVTTGCTALSLPKNNKQVPEYLATAPTANATNTAINDTVYLIAQTNNAATLWTWNTGQGNCNFVSAASVGSVVSGVAVAPAPVTLLLPVTATVANPTPTPFDFHSSLFQLIATGCTASVTAYPMNPGTVQSLISLVPTSGANSLPNPAVPGVNLGEQGYEIIYVAHWLTDLPPVDKGVPCSSVFNDGGFVELISAFIDNNSSNNPRMVKCDDSDPTTEPQLFNSPTTSCIAPPTTGVYPLGGPIVGDMTLRQSFFAVVNEATNTTVEQGEFCGFEPKLINTTDPAKAATFSQSVSTVNVKFKLADLTHGGICKSGPYIDDAVALISVARLADANGPFQAINVQANSSDFDVPPLFGKPNSGNTQQYSFTLNIPNIFAQAGTGTYSLTVTFLSNNTTNQTIVFNVTQ